MKVKDFYLIESVDTSILDEPQKKFLDKQLSLYRKGVSVIEKISAILKVVLSENLKGIQFQYNEWLFNFVSERLKTNNSEEETQYLLKTLSTCYNQFGVMQYYESKYNKALSYYNKAIEIAEKQDNKERLLATYQNISLVYRKQGDITSALETYEKSTPLIKYIKDERYLARYYINIGIVFEQQGNYLKSLDYFYKGLEIFEKNNLEKDTGIACHNIGDLLVKQGEIDAALKHYSKALALYQKVAYENGESGLYVCIGKTYQKKKENNIALEYYDKAIQIQKRLKLKDRLATSYLQIGAIYESQNEPALALKYYNNSLQLSEKIRSKEILSKVLSKIGIFKIKKSVTEETKQQIQLAFTLAREIDNPELIRDAATAKVSLAIAMGNYKVAYEMERLKNDMKDTIQNEEIRKEVIKQQYKYEKERELIKKDLEIELEKENALLMEEQGDILTLKNEELASKNKIINKQVNELEELIQKLQESNESLNQFAAVAAHDLKAPLRNIQGFSQLLHKKYAAQFPKGDLDLFMYIINGCTSLKELIDGLLNYSRISSVNLELECVDLTDIVSDVKNNLTNVIEETNVTLHISDKLPKVLGQHSLLFQVFLNFINNAIKFRRIEEGLQSTIWIESSYYDDEYIKISIKDNGIGIEKKHQEQVFGIFKKLHSSTEYEGSGIGLSVCKKIIERSGGKVWLESEKNVGTTFFFTVKQWRSADN